MNSPVPPEWGDQVDGGIASLRWRKEVGAFAVPDTRAFAGPGAAVFMFPVENEDEGEEDVNPVSATGPLVLFAEAGEEGEADDAAAGEELRKRRFCLQRYKARPDRMNRAKRASR